MGQLPLPYLRPEPSCIAVRDIIEPSDGRRRGLVKVEKTFEEVDASLAKLEKAGGNGPSNT